MFKYIPEDINIEDVMLYLPKETYRISIDGLHKRNTYKDIISYEETAEGITKFHIGRKSLYNSLPEYIFHPINRFDDIPEVERKERFSDECEKQEQETEDAHAFFSPIDILLLDLKSKVKNTINQLTSENKVIQNIIADTLTEEEKANRFIKRTLPFLPICKRIRGNSTLITLLLRKVLFEEGLLLEKENIGCDVIDKNPQYNNEIEDFQLGSLYLGNEFTENVTSFIVNYWSDEECSEHFNAFIKEIEDFRLFVKDYFLSIEDDLCFHIIADYPT